MKEIVACFMTECSVSLEFFDKTSEVTVLKKSCFGTVSQDAERNTANTEFVDYCLAITVPPLPSNPP
jgi:hypothetical protein